MRILLGTPNPPLSLLIQRVLTRFHYEWKVEDNGLDVFQKIIGGKFDLLILEFNLPRMNAVEILRRLGALENYKMPPVIVLTFSEAERDAIEREHFPRTHVVSRPMAIRPFVDVVQQILHQAVRVACFGGGTGLFTLLSGLKTIPGLHLSSIVSMSDDGGSTGKLRSLFGILPPGDIRRSLVALSTAPDLLNELMQYRFEKESGGELGGHNLGNLLLTALIHMRGGMSHAVKGFGEILNIVGEVIPVTETTHMLKAELENGKTIEGEHRIDLFEGHDPNLRIQRLWLDPSVSANPDALEAIFNAHYILLGPGDLFTSVIPNFLVEGIANAISSSRAKKIYVCNVMTKPGETTNFSAGDHVTEIVKYLGKDCLDYVVCSSTEFSPDAVKRYKTMNQQPVEDNAPKIKDVTKAHILWGDIASEEALVRHDSLKLSTFIKKIIDEAHRKVA